jgi:hypothetical protein
MPEPNFEYPESIEAYLAQLQRGRDYLASAANSASRAVDERPAPDRWSVAEVLYHLYLTEKTASAALAQAAAGERHERKSDEHLRNEWELVVKVGSNRENKLTAPAPFSPQGAPPLEEIWILLGESRQSSLVFLNSLTIDDMASVSRTHPAIGPMTLAGWFTLLALHDYRHALQIEEINRQR